MPGTFVCNIGDMTQCWTNDLFRSTVHRVVNRVRRERYSVAFFTGPNPETMVGGGWGGGVPGVMQGCRWMLARWTQHCSIDCTEHAMSWCCGAALIRCLINMGPLHQLACDRMAAEPA